MTNATFGEHLADSFATLGTVLVFLLVGAILPLGAYVLLSLLPTPNCRNWPYGVWVYLKMGIPCAWSLLVLVFALAWFGATPGLSIEALALAGVVVWYLSKTVMYGARVVAKGHAVYLVYRQREVVIRLPNDVQVTGRLDRMTERYFVIHANGMFLLSK